MSADIPRDIIETVDRMMSESRVYDDSGISQYLFNRDALIQALLSERRRNMKDMVKSNLTVECWEEWGGVRIKFTPRSGVPK